MRARPIALVCFALALAACGSDGPSAPAAEGTGTAAWDGPIGDNGEYTFTPSDPGTTPGLRVEAEVEGQVLSSGELEILLAPYDGIRTVDRALTLPDLPVPDVDIDDIDLSSAALTPRVVGGFGDDAIATPEATGVDVAAAFADAAAALSLEGMIGAPKIECPGRTPGMLYPDMGTFDSGFTVWQVASFGITDLGGTATYAWVTHYAPEGVYISLQAGTGFTAPPLSAGIDVTTGYGILHSPEAPRVSASTIEGISASLSFSYGFISFGMTIFVAEIGFIHRGIQLDVGVSIGSIGFLPINIPVSITVANGQITTRTRNEAGEDVGGFAFVTGYDGRCSTAESKQLRTLTQPLDPAASLTELRDHFATMAAADPVDPPSALRAATGQAGLPLMTLLADAGGAPPDEGIAASTNGAWLSEFATIDSNALCDDCPDTTVDGILFDTVRRLQHAGDNTFAAVSAAADSGGQLLRAWPQPAQQWQLQEQARGSIDTAFAQAFANAAELRGDPDYYVDDEVIVIETEAGASFDIVITAAEIADLVGATPADVQGATVCLQMDYSGPRAEDMCGQLDGDEIVATLALNDATSMLLGAPVDLSTAAGFTEEQVEGWAVRPALRLIVAAAGPVDRLDATAPAQVYAGAPATISASLLDAEGNISSAAATYRFYGPDGSLLGEVTTDTGVASYTFVPEPVSPTVAGVAADTFFIGGGDDPTQVEGWLVTGTGLSTHATVLLDGVDVLTLGWAWRTLSSTEGALLPSAQSGFDDTDAPLQPIDPGAHRLEVISPGQRSSGEVSATF